MSIVYMYPLIRAKSKDNQKHNKTNDNYRCGLLIFFLSDQLFRMTICNFEMHDCIYFLFVVLIHTVHVTGFT